ncbi:MAG TPA: nucleotidyltransferase domain-containing protein [Solirubrobacteraceae bacterium]|jgi:predicted nucleotidyltransferase
MRTSAPAILPLFRSEMQIRMLALLLLQPERSWTLQELAQALVAPASSVHRELGRAEAAGLIRRSATARPHLFQAAPDDPLYEPLASLLRRSVGVEEQLRAALEGPDVLVALIYGSWAGGTRRPDSDIDVLVVGDADLRDLRRRVRPIGKAAGRTIDLTVTTAEEFQRLLAERSSFARRVLEAPITQLVGDLANIAQP